MVNKSLNASERPLIPNSGQIITMDHVIKFEVLHAYIPYRNLLTLSLRVHYFAE